MQGIELAESYHWRAVADPHKRFRPPAFRSLPARTAMNVW